MQFDNGTLWGLMIGRKGGLTNYARSEIFDKRAFRNGPVVSRARVVPWMTLLEFLQRIQEYSPRTPRANLWDSAKDPRRDAHAKRSTPKTSLRVPGALEALAGWRWSPREGQSTIDPGTPTHLLEEAIVQIDERMQCLPNNHKGRHTLKWLGAWQLRIRQILEARSGEDNADLAL